MRRLLCVFIHYKATRIMAQRIIIAGQKLIIPRVCEWSTSIAFACSRSSIPFCTEHQASALSCISNEF